MRHILAMLLCACGSPVALEDAAVEPPDLAPPRDAVTQDRRAPLDLVAAVDEAAPIDLLSEADLAQGSRVVASSEFTTDDEGWQLVKGVLPAFPAGTGVTFSPKWHPSFGNHGGCIYNDATGVDAFWQAPTTFLGNKAAVYGGVLRFSFKGQLPCCGSDLVLIGGGITATRQIPMRANLLWEQYTVSFASSDWHHDTYYGEALEEWELRAVLADLTMLRIKSGGAGVGVNGAAFLDDVSLRAP